MTAPASNSNRSEAPRPSIWQAGWVNTIGRFVVLLVVFAFFALAVENGKFYTPRNLESILRQSAVYATAAFGMTLVIIAGGIDLSVGSMIALTVVVVAWVLNLSVRRCCDRCRAASRLLDLSMAEPVTDFGRARGRGRRHARRRDERLADRRTRSGAVHRHAGHAGNLARIGQGHYRAERHLSAGKHLVERHHGSHADSVSGLARAARVHSRPAASNGWCYRSACGFLIIAATVAALLLRYTRFGRHVFAVGSNESTARLCGVPVERTKVIVYMLAGFFAGLAGFMQFSYEGGNGYPTTAMGYELHVIAAVVLGGGSLLGGEGSILGSVVGALMITILKMGGEQMDWPKWVQEAVIGGIIIAAATLDRVRHRGAR